MIVKRPGINERFMAMAFVVSLGGTCRRRRVGCILVDEHKHVMATGFNGPAATMDHCLDAPCKGASLPSGTGLDMCHAIHAEANALMQCKDIHKIVTAYCTDSPCINCVKLLLNTSCQRIVFGRRYPHDDAERLWLQAGRQWIYHNDFMEINTVDPNPSIVARAMAENYGVTK